MTDRNKHTCRREVNARLDDFNSIRAHERFLEAKTNKLRRMSHKRRKALTAPSAPANNASAGPAGQQQYLDGAGGTHGHDEDDDGAPRFSLFSRHSFLPLCRGSFSKVVFNFLRLGVRVIRLIPLSWVVPIAFACFASGCSFGLGCLRVPGWGQ